MKKYIIGMTGFVLKKDVNEMVRILKKLNKFEKGVRVPKHYTMRNGEIAIVYKADYLIYTKKMNWFEFQVILPALIMRAGLHDKILMEIGWFENDGRDVKELYKE